MRCYLCQHEAFNLRKGAVRDDPSLQILECVECGLVTLSSLDHIREGHYENSGMHGAAIPSMDSWLRETAIDDRRRFEMMKARMINRRVLDFGCGAAGFVSFAQTVAAHVAGVEPERRVHDHYTGAIRVHPSLEEVGADYDVITAFHVVEHLPDPRRTLAELAQRLSPAGSLVIEVPCATDALLTLYDCDAFQHFTYWSQHLFLFTAETLQRLATQAGLRVVAVQQLQRYPLSNHLHWLCRGLPGGHQRWSFLDTPELTEAYAASLASVGKCDTLIAYLERPPA